MEKPDYFMDLNMPQYGKVGLIEARGLHYFTAFGKSKGDGGLLFKFLLLEILFVNDKKVDEKFIDEMLIKDVSYLVTVISTMMDNSHM